MVPDSFRENQGSEGHVCLLDFAMSALFRNITYKMLSAAIPFNKSLFKGMVKSDSILWESDNENHEEKKRPLLTLSWSFLESFVWTF